MRTLLAGGTGLVGSTVIEAGTKAGIELVGVGRRASGKLAEEVVTNLIDFPALPSAETAICTLGTTIRAAGSRDAFRAVDYGAVMAFAAAARSAGTSHFIVVTAVGANPQSTLGIWLTTYWHSHLVLHPASLLTTLTIFRQATEGKPMNNPGCT